MRKAIAMMIVMALSVSLWADSAPARPTKSQTTEIRFPDHMPSDRTETYQLYLIDSYGDGWNGASLDLFVNGTIVLDDATIDDGDQATYDFDVDDFDYISTTWQSGAYDGECAYAIYDAEGAIVAEAGTSENFELTLTHTVDVSGVNLLDNSGFEGGIAEWGSYPGYNFDVVTTGDGMYNSDETFTAYDGAKSFKMWGLYWDGASENNLYHEWSGDDATAMVGETIDMSAMFYSHNADFIGQGNSHGKLTAKYFGPGTNGEWWNDMLFMDESDHFDASSATADTWANYTLSTTVPEGVYLMQYGFMLYQPTSGDHGSVYVDNFVASVQVVDEECDDTEYVVTLDGGSWQSEVTWSITDEDGGEVVSGAAPITVADDVTACLADGVYTLNMYDAYGDGWNGNIFTLWTYDGTDYTEFFSTTLESGSEGTAAIIVGESDDVFGCTDPDAINYNPDATIDDGSCYYAGDQCDIALDFVAAGGATDGSAAVEAATTAAGDVDWYTFTLDQDWENLTVSLSGSAFDTQLDVYSDCETLLGYNDDYDGVQSQVDLFSVTAGTYHCQVYGYGSAFGNYTLTINAFMDPTNPTNLSALGGLERVYLSWDPAEPAGTAASAGGGFQGTVDEHIQWQYDNKKEPVNADIPFGRSREAVIEEMQNNDTQTRDTEVLVTLFDSYGDGHYGGDSDGDAYVVDADGNVLHTLEGPWTGSSATFGPFTFADGTYAVEWDPTAPWLSEQTMEVVLASDTTVVLGFGAAPSACFALGDGNSCSNPDLTVDNVTFDNWTGRATVTVSNIGGQDAGYFYTMAFIQEPDTTQTYPPGYFQYAWEGVGLAAGATADFYLATYLTLPGFVGGYDDETYTVYAMADGYGNYVLEESEGNNVGSTTVVNSNPLGNSTWNVWRDGAVVDNISAPAWQPGESVLYTDEPLTADVEYCYMVTQVDGTTETAASNESCATPSAPPDVPEPTDLAGSSSGFDVTLTWTAPEPYEGTAIFSGTPSSTRQGGEDIENATVITELGQLTGTTAGYVDDYDEVCPYVGGGATDVVYSFTPETDVAVNLTTCYSSFDTKMYIYANEVGVLATTITGADACSDDTYPPGVDDCTAWTSYIEGAWMTAGNTYYLVIDGYGASQGDYIVDVELYNPLAGYTVWSMGDDGSASPVGQAGPTATEWNTVLFAAEPTDLDLALTADYNIPGIFDPVISDVVGPVTVTVQIEDNPGNLVAQDYGDDVHLMWDPPIDASSMELAYDDGVVANAWWYGGAVAVRFRINGTYSINGLANSVWTGGWPDAFLGETPFTLSVLALDTETDLPGDTLYQEAILVDADPTSETYGWAQTSALAEEPVTVTGDVFIMYSDFGYDFENAGPGPDMDMMGCDAVLDFPGNKYDYNVSLSEEWALSVDYGSLTCGDWILHMFADFTAGGNTSFGDNGTWVDQSGSSSIADLPPSFATMEAANTKENPTTLMNPPVSDPTWSHETLDREMLNYNIYRDGEVVGEQVPGVHDYMDGGLDWGTYTYYVTALYDDHESIATNSVEVTLSNVAPDAVMLISPGDDLDVSVDDSNMEEEVAFIWTAANDADNDPVEYFLVAEGVVGEDSVDTVVPSDRVYNGSFEEGTIDGWSPYPEGNASWVVDSTGAGIYGSDATLEVYDGHYALKQWGQYDGTNDNYGSFGQWYNIGDLGLEVGTEARLGGAMMSHADDWVGQGGNMAYLVFYFYDDGYNWTGEGYAMSDVVDANAEASAWHEVEVSTIIPENTTMVWAGVEFYQPTGDDHGSVYTDDVWMYTPLYTTGIFVPFGALAEEALEAGVPEMTWTWDVWAFDGFEATPSSSGPRDIHVDVSELLGIDGASLPKEFALHNNYPNPFNPVTNIVYDIPEVTDVTLEIYNVMGQRVRTLAQGSHEPGRYQIVWNATNDFGQALSSGMYIYRIQAGDFVSVKKLVLMK